MTVPFVDLHRQYLSHKEELDTAMAEVITHTAFISGHYVDQFEAEFAAWLGVNHVIACANGTDSLEILLDAFGVGPGDEVIVPAMTWISTAEAVGSRGANPVFVDVDESWTINPHLIEEQITKRTKGIIPVHLYGCPADMPNIMSIAEKYGLFVLEDCAQSHGATINNKKTGTWGHAASFSFYPGKNLGAYGDAGGMATNDSNLAAKAQMIANHGQTHKHNHLIEGRNSRMDGIQAAILSVKLKHLDAWTLQRQNHADTYDIELAKCGLRLPTRYETRKSVHHLYVVEHTERNRLRANLDQMKIQTAIHYPKPLPALPCYGAWNTRAEELFPTAMSMASRIFSLPMFPELTVDELYQVTNSIKSLLQ